MVRLGCAQCRSILEITPDLDRFACSHCGREQWVIREDGTIRLVKTLLGVSWARPLPVDDVPADGALEAPMSAGRRRAAERRRAVARARRTRATDREADAAAASVSAVRRARAAAAAPGYHGILKDGMPEDLPGAGLALVVLAGVWLALFWTIGLPVLLALAGYALLGVVALHLWIDRRQALAERRRGR